MFRANRYYILPSFATLASLKIIVLNVLDVDFTFCSSTSSDLQMLPDEDEPWLTGKSVSEHRGVWLPIRLRRL